MRFLFICLLFPFFYCNSQSIQGKYVAQFYNYRVYTVYGNNKGYTLYGRYSIPNKVIFFNYKLLNDTTIQTIQKNDTIVRTFKFKTRDTLIINEQIFIRKKWRKKVNPVYNPPVF